MANISIKGENIQLSKGEYIIIDALYMDDIKKYVTVNNQTSVSLSYIKDKVFPYTVHPFALISIKKTTSFSVSQIIISHEANEKNLHVFDTDTGLIIFVKKDYIFSYAKNFSYNDLVERDPIDVEYWAKLALKYPSNSLGLVLAPGIGSKFDFNGGGTYEIFLEQLPHQHQIP